MAAPPIQALPLREQQLFKGLLRSFELQHYKKGLKSSEQILRKFPEHGETLAMKGIFLVNMDRKDEGYEYVRKGLRYDLKSYICWHVYGLIHRKYKDYDEAIKCYRNALRFEKNNMQIQRDLSILLIQQRQYDGYSEARGDLLALSTHQRPSWVGWAISLHLVREYDLAVQVIDAYDSAHRSPPPRSDFEHGELLLYKALILEESGDLPRALAHLEDIKGRVGDVQAWMESHASILLRLERYDEALDAYTRLLERNPDAKANLTGYIASKARTNGPIPPETLLAECALLSSTYPRSTLLRRHPLAFASGDAFRSLVDAYLRHGLRKGVPSLYISLKDLYTDTEKASIIGELISSYLPTLSAPSDPSFPGDEATVEPPTSLLWALYYLAQHQDKLGDRTAALATIDRAIAHTPTLVDLHMARARILKHTGRISDALAAMETSRAMDLQDRYINTKAAKYALRAGDVPKATATVGLFTRKAILPAADLEDLQCNWWSIECGRSYAAQGQWTKAIANYRTALCYFDIYWDDQLDFHSYALRRSTLRDYVRMLRFEDHLHSHPFYTAAVKGILSCFLALDDISKGIVPPSTSGSDAASQDPSVATMSPAELKKFRNKQRKAELKAKLLREEEEAKAHKGSDAAKAKQEPKPEASVAEEAIEKPLEEAVKVWNAFRLRHGPSPIPADLLLLASDALARSEKFTQELKCLHEASLSTPASSSLLPRIKERLSTAKAALFKAHMLNPLK